jgi:hypothetical protein
MGPLPKEYKLRSSAVIARVRRASRRKIKTTSGFSIWRELKMKLKKMLTGYLLALALTLPNAVLAEDFTFAVKIDLKNLLPDITDIKVGCFVGPDDRFFTEFLIGSGSTTVSVPTGGSINRTVKVRFDANPGKNPADATHVGCSFSLIDQKGIASIPLRSTSSDCEQKDNFGRCQKAGTELTTFIKDPLP